MAQTAKGVLMISSRCAVSFIATIDPSSLGKNVVRPSDVFFQGKLNTCSEYSVSSTDLQLVCTGDDLLASFGVPARPGQQGHPRTAGNVSVVQASKMASPAIPKQFRVVSSKNLAFWGVHWADHPCCPIDIIDLQGRL